MLQFGELSLELLVVLLEALVLCIVVSFEAFQFGNTCAQILALTKEACALLAVLAKRRFKPVLREPQLLQHIRTHACK